MKKQHYYLTAKKEPDTGGTNDTRAAVTDHERIQLPFSFWAMVYRKKPRVMRIIGMVEID